MPRRLPLFSTAARGTEELLAEELAELGAVRVRADRGGVRFLANLNEALRIALWSRIAMRLLWPLAETEAHGARGPLRRCPRVPWEEHLDPGRDLRGRGHAARFGAHPLGLRGPQDQGRPRGSAPRAPGRAAGRRHPTAGRARRRAPRGHPSVAVARRRRRAAQPARLPRAAHRGASQGDARRRHPPRSPLHRRRAAGGPDVRLGHVRHRGRAHRGAARSRTSIDASASSAGRRSGAEARAILDRLRGRGARERAACALPHPRLRPEPRGGGGRPGQRPCRTAGAGGHRGRGGRHPSAPARETWTTACW